MFDSEDGGGAVLSGFIALMAATLAGYFIGYVVWVPIYIHPRVPYYFEFMHPGNHGWPIAVGGAGLVVTALGVVFLAAGWLRGFPRELLSGFVALGLGLLLTVVVAPRMDAPAQAIDKKILSAVEATRAASVSAKCYAVEVHNGRAKIGNPCGRNNRSGALLLRISGLPAEMTSQSFEKVSFNAHCGIDQTDPLGNTAVYFAVRRDEMLGYDNVVLSVPPASCLVKSQDGSIREVNFTVALGSERTPLNESSSLISESIKIDKRWWL